ncbi:hypothetical protein M6B38_291160 [Iris pallida]|uniref:Uncharacterized protein n=1 Tax=Iris pallida TaxID=29817 RepID=A0AAX6HUH7_IRIPA|nr:hypothetical protein M6B38_291160 [Iris pallida]
MSTGAPPSSKPPRRCNRWLRSRPPPPFSQILSTSLGAAVPCHIPSSSRLSSTRSRRRPPRSVVDRHRSGSQDSDPPSLRHASDRAFARTQLLFQRLVFAAELGESFAGEVITTTMQYYSRATKPRQVSGRLHGACDCIRILQLFILLYFWRLYFWISLLYIYFI